MGATGAPESRTQRLEPSESVKSVVRRRRNVWCGFNFDIRHTDLLLQM
jgi:hypothetical protein